jgi:hypothetical protein
VQNAALDAQGTVSGGELSVWLDSTSNAYYSARRFGIGALRRPGTAPNTFSVSFNGSYDMAQKLTPDTLDMYGALGNAVVNLTKHEDGTSLQPDELRKKRVGKVLIIMRFDTQGGDSLQYRKVAVVDILPGNGSSTTIKLRRP